MSDIALFLLYAAILCESRFLASMTISGHFVYALAWVVDFLYTLVSPAPGYTGYMLNAEVPLGLRVLSLFHLALPPLMVWTVYRLGYDRRAWRVQLVVSTAVFVLSWLIVSPDRNINFVFGYRDLGWEPLPYLIVVSLVNGLIVVLTHGVIRRGMR
jgi:hypothetical protein